MGFVDRGATVDPFDQAAFSIPLNTISDPIRSKEFGYHIIKVLERKAAGYRSFEEVRPTLAAQLTEGGRLVAPVGDADMQELVVRDARGHEERYGAVRFVPLRGRAGFS